MVKVFSIICMLISFNGIAQIQVHSILYADSLLIEESKPMCILISAPWCKWCDKMKYQTFQDEALTEEFGEEFLFLELDAEYDGDISFLSSEYHSISNEYHGLAQALAGKDKVELPTIIILNTIGEVIFDYGGYLDADDLISVLRSK